MGEFRFKQFSVSDSRSAMKIGTDGVLLGAWCPLEDYTLQRQSNIVWDIGSGTGLLALMMAQRLPEAKITAVEIDDGAAQDARYNFAASPWDDRLTLIHSDIFTLLPNDFKDLQGINDLPNPPLLPAAPGLIICNPPFYNEDIHSPEATRTAARHEGSLGIESLIALAARTLPPGGALVFIAPWKRRNEIEYLASLHRHTPTHLVPVITREGREPSRLLVRLIRDTSIRLVERTPLTIRDRANKYTPQYIALTQDFYLHLH